MNAPAAFDLQRRRSTAPQDQGQIVQNIQEGADAFAAHVAGWRLTFLREQHLAAAERMLTALRAQLAALRGHVSPEVQS